MKIEVKQTIEVPDKLICSVNRSACGALTSVPEAENYKICAHFNRIVWWSDRAGYFVRCKDCIEAQREYLDGK